MKWLAIVLLACAASDGRAESVWVCYNYGCLAQAQANFSEEQLRRVQIFLAAAGNPQEERAHLSQTIGWLLGWAGELTPIATDRGGNFADDGVFGRMDCIDHSTTTTRLLRLLEKRGWLRYHRVLDPAMRQRFLFFTHYSAQIEELAGVGDESDAAEPVRFVVDSWFRDNGRPAVVLPLEHWLAGEGEEESDASLLAGEGSIGRVAGGASGWQER